MDTLVSYVETYGDNNLVLVFLGDHQPAPIVTGDGREPRRADHDRGQDPTVLDRISSWGWTPGLRPARTRRCGRWTRSATGS